MAEALQGRTPEELERLARSMRGSLASLRAASETLERFPELGDERRARLRAVLAEESAHLGDLIGELEHMARARGAERGPRASIDEWLSEIARAIAGTGLDCEEERELDGLAGGTKLPSAPGELADAVGELLADLRRECAVTRCRLRARATEGYLLIDLGWQPEAGDLPHLFEWQRQALGARGEESAGGRGLRAVARELGGDTWFIVDRDDSAAHVRVLLPLEREAPAA